MNVLAAAAKDDDGRNHTLTLAHNLIVNVCQSIAEMWVIVFISLGNYRKQSICLNVEC